MNKPVVTVEVPPKPLTRSEAIAGIFQMAAQIRASLPPGDSLSVLVGEDMLQYPPAQPEPTQPQQST